MNPITLGHDLVVEFSKATIRDVLLATGQTDPGGESDPVEIPSTFTPPFEIHHRASGARAIVRDLTLDFAPDGDGVAVTLGIVYDSGSATEPLEFTGLAGTIEIDVPVRIDIAAGIASLVVDLPQSIRQTDTAPQLDEALDDWILTLPAIPLGALPVAPDGQDGSLDPPTFSSFRLHAIGAPGQADQSLMIGADIIADRPDPDPSLRTEPLTTAADGAVLAVSEEGVRDAVLCATLVDQLDLTDASQLPPACGPASEATIEGPAKLRHADVQLRTGHAELSGRVFAELGDHGDVTVDVSIRVQLSLDGEVIAARIFEPRIDSRANLSFWARLFMVGQLIDQVTMLARFWATSMAEKYGSFTLVPTSVLGPVEPLALEHTEEAVILRARVPVELPASQEPALGLAVDVDRQETIVDDCEFEETTCLGTKTYRSVAYAVTETQTVTVQPTMIPRPWTITWSFDLGNRTIPLPGSGTVEIPDIDVRYESVMGTGYGVGGAPVELDYVRSGDSISFTNRPADGNYTLRYLRADVSTRGGDGPQMSALEPLFVTGSRAERDTQYRQDKIHCFLEEAGDYIREHLDNPRFVEERLKGFEIPDLPRDFTRDDLDPVVLDVLLREYAMDRPTFSEATDLYRLSEDLMKADLTVQRFRLSREMEISDKVHSPLPPKA